MSFNPANVASPAHGLILDRDDNAYYTDAAGNKVPIVVGVIPDASNVLNAMQGGATVLAADLEVHNPSTIEEMSRPPFFKAAGGQKVPIMALVGFDSGKNLLPPALPSANPVGGSLVTRDASGNAQINVVDLGSVSHGDFATGGAIGTAAATVDIASVALIAQTTAAQTLTLPSPTAAAFVRTMIVANTGTASFTLLGATVAAGAAQMALWTGSAWMAVA